MGNDTLMSMATTEEFSPLGLVRYFESSIATALFVECDCNFSKIHYRWFALLVEPGSLLFHAEQGMRTMVYVVDSCEWGVTAWLPTPLTCEGQKYLSFREGHVTDRWKYVHITDLKGWMVIETKAMPPSCCKARRADGAPRGVVITALTSAGTPIVEYAANKAFRSLTIPFMKKLIVHLEIPVDRMPSLEYELAKLLVQFVRPDLDDAALADVLGQRKAKPFGNVRFETALTLEAVEKLSDVLGDDVTVEFANEAKSYAKQVHNLKLQGMQQNALARGKGRGKGSTKKKVCGERDLRGLDEARCYLPLGAELSQESQWHTRWKATYVGSPTPPFSHGKNYVDGDARSKRDALIHVLKWVWEKHERATSERCPFELE